MFCTQCGTQVDAGKNFCRNCGAPVGRGAGGAAETDEAPSSTVVATAGTSQAVQSHGRAAIQAPVALSLREGASSRTLMIVAGVLVVLLGGAGVYFMSGSSKPAEPVLAPPPAAQEAVSSKAPESVPLPSFPDRQEPAAGAGSQPAALPQFDPEPDAPVEKPKPAPVESARKSSSGEALPPASKPQPQKAGQDAARGSKPASVPAARGGANPGTYETVRSTPVHEDPLASSRVVANIPAGVRVNVVSSNGDWLEVHSRRGNPPGFIRRGDAVFVESPN